MGGLRSQASKPAYAYAKKGAPVGMLVASKARGLPRESGSSSSSERALIEQLVPAL